MKSDIHTQTTYERIIRKQHTLTYLITGMLHVVILGDHKSTGKYT